MKDHWEAAAAQREKGSELNDLKLIKLLRHHVCARLCDLRRLSLEISVSETQDSLTLSFFLNSSDRKDRAPELL